MERVEVRGVIASKQGLSCEGFYMLFNRTDHLRDRLYVTVRDGDKLFLPADREHFPCKEIEEFYVKRLRVGFFQSVGAKGEEIVFTVEGPAAEEGAEAIQAALPDVDEATNLSLAPRWVSAIPEKCNYLQTINWTFTRPYRPEHLPERAGPPEPFTEEQAERYDPYRLLSSLSLFEKKKREALAAWGMLDDYDRMQASRARTKPPQQAPWEETFWT